MRKIILIILSIFAIFIVVLFTVFFIIKSYLTPERVKDFTEKTLKQALQREVKIEKIEPRVSLFNAGILSEGIKIYEDKKKKFVSIDEMEFSLKILPLIFKKTLEIEKIYIKEPEVFIYTEVKDVGKGKAPEKKEKAEIPIFFILQKLEIERGKIHIIPEKGKRTLIYPFNLKLSSKHIEKNLIEFKGEGEIGYSEFKKFSPLKFAFNFNFDIAKDIAEIKRYTLKINALTLSGEGEIKGLIEGKPEYKLILESENIPLSVLKDLSRIKDVDFKGKIDISLKVKGKYTDKVPYIRGDIEGKEVAIKTKEREIDFSKLKIKFKGYKGNFEAEFMSGKQKGDLDFEFSLLPPNKFKGKGKIKGNLIEFTQRDKNYSITFNINGSSQGKLDIKGKFTAGKNDITFNLKGEKKRKLFYVRGNINSNYLNLNEIMPEEKKEEKGKKKGKPPELILPKGISLFINGAVRNFIFKEDNLRDIRFNLEVDEKGIRIKNLKGKVFGGSIDGNISVEKGSIIVKSNLKGNNIEFSELLKKHKFLPSLITGKLSIKTKSRFNLEDVLGTLYAENAVLVFNGEFKKDPVLEKIADILKIKELKNLKFKKINVKLKIERGWINFPDFRIEAPDYLVIPKGKASLKGNLDINLLIKFKGKSAEKLRKYSSFAKYFMNKKGDFELYFILKGTYKNPKVSLDTKKFEEKLKKEIKKEVKKKAKKKMEQEIKKGLEELKKRFGF